MFDALYANGKVKLDCESDDQAPEAIDRLVNDKLTVGNNVERLDKNRWAIRVNDQKRIIFTYNPQCRYPNGRLAPIILRYDKLHGFDDKFIDPQVYSAFIAANKDRFISEIEAQMLQKNPNPIEKPKVERMHLIGKKVIVFDEFQASIKAPAIIEGVAGSGKTTVAYKILEEFLEKYEPGQKAVYVTQSEDLANYMRKVLTQNEAYDHLKHKDQLQVMTYKELLDSLYPGLKFVEDSKKAVTEWLMAATGVIGKDIKGAKRKERAELLYLEFRIICGFENPDEYLQVSEKITNFSKDKRHDILKAYLRFKNEWDYKKEGYFRDFIELPPQGKGIYNLVVGDEGQDLSNLQLFNLKLLAKGKIPNLLICHDPKQNLKDNANKGLFLEELLHIKSIRLLKSYRCPPKVMRSAKVINDLRLKLVKTGKQEAEIQIPSEIDEKDETNGLAVWLDAKEQSNLTMLNRMKNDPDVYFIADEEDCKILRDQGFIRVFTVDSIKGLQNKKIVVYRPFKIKEHSKLNAALVRSNEGSAVDKEGNLVFGPGLCELFTSLTRAENEVIIFQENHPELSELMKDLRSVCKDECSVTKDVEQDKQKSLEDAEKIFKENNDREMASKILKKEVFFGESDLEIKVKKQLQQWEDEENATAETLLYKKQLEEALESENIEALNQLVSDVKFQAMFKDGRDNAFVRKLLQVVLSTKSNSGLVAHIINVSQICVKILGPDFNADNPDDEALFGQAVDRGLGYVIICSKYYDFNKALKYCYNRGGFLAFFRTVWEYFAYIPDTEMKGGIHDIFIRLIATLQVEQHEPILKILMVSFFREGETRRKLNTKARNLIQSQAREYALTEPAYWIDEAVNSIESPQGDFLDNYRQVMSQLRAKMGEAPCTVTLNGSDDEIDALAHVDIYHYLRNLDIREIMRWVRSSYFCESITENPRLFDYLLVALYLQADPKLYLVLLDKLSDTESFKNSLTYLRCLHLSCLLLYGEKRSSDLDIVLEQSINKLVEAPAVAPSLFDYYILKESERCGRLKDLFGKADYSFKWAYKWFSTRRLGDDFFYLAMRFFCYLTEGEVNSRFSTPLKNFLAFLTEFLEEYPEKVHNHIGRLINDHIPEKQLNLTMYMVVGYSVKEHAKTNPKARTLLTYAPIPVPEPPKPTSDADIFKCFEAKQATPGEEEVALEGILANPSKYMKALPMIITGNHSDSFNWNYQCKEHKRTLLMILLACPPDKRPVGYLEALRHLVDKIKVRLDIRDRYGYSAFVHAAYAMKDTTAISVITSSDRFDFSHEIESVPEKVKPIVFRNIFSSELYIESLNLKDKEYIMRSQCLREEFAKYSPRSYLELFLMVMVIDGKLAKDFRNNFIAQVKNDIDKNASARAVKWVKNELSIRLILSSPEVLRSFFDFINRNRLFSCLTVMIATIAQSTDPVFRNIALKIVLEWLVSNACTSASDRMVLAKHTIDCLGQDINPTCALDLSIFPGTRPATNPSAGFLFTNEYYDLEKAFNFFVSIKGQSAGFTYLEGCWKYFAYHQGAGQEGYTWKSFYKMADLFQKHHEKKFLLIMKKYLNEEVYVIPVNIEIAATVAELTLKLFDDPKGLTESDSIDGHLAAANFYYLTSTRVKDPEAALRSLRASKTVCQKVYGMNASDAQRKLHITLVENVTTQFAVLHQKPEESPWALKLLHIKSEILPYVNSGQQIPENLIHDFHEHHLADPIGQAYLYELISDPPYYFKINYQDKAIQFTPLMFLARNSDERSLAALSLAINSHHADLTLRSAVGLSAFVIALISKAPAAKLKIFFSCPRFELKTSLEYTQAYFLTDALDKLFGIPDHLALLRDKDIEYILSDSQLSSSLKEKAPEFYEKHRVKFSSLKMK